MTSALHVAGNRLVDQNGHPFQLRGVNRSGGEYACQQGWGFSDGPVDEAAVAAIASWGANAVRLPLNEDCWLGLDAASPYSGASYRTWVHDLVARLHHHGLVPVLDLQWAESTGPATGTAELPDAKHAPRFWSSVASEFRDDHALVLDLYNEPRDVSWGCWRDGCTVKGGWKAAGMQSLVDAVRSTGATQPLMLGGLAYANDLSRWMTYRPHDPAGQLVASFHVYADNTCRSTSCWDSQVAPVSSQVPVVTGEVGEYDGGVSLLNAYLPWADAHGISYLGWSWNVWKERTALISSYDGVPTEYGRGLRDHLLSRSGSPGPTALAYPISRGQPASASSETYPATHGNDGDPAHQWRSAGYPAWLAYDLSAVPADHRGTVLSSWTSRGTYDYDTAVFPGPTYNLPADYVVEAVSAPGGAVPQTGWVPLVEVHDNAFHSAAQVVDLGARNWVRLRVLRGDPANSRENTDCALTWDLYGGKAAAGDAWIFYGDSITADAMSPAPTSGTSPSFAAQVHEHRPGLLVSQQNGGVGGLALHQALTSGLLARWLAGFPGHYAALSFGTNDASRSDFSAASFRDDLRAAVRLVEQAGKRAVVPTLVASRTPEVQANGPSVNAAVRDLWAADPAVVHGPDLWSLFSEHPKWISQDRLHPGPDGSSALRDAWARTVLATVYAEPPR